MSNKKDSKFVRFILIEVEQILNTLSEIIQQPDIIDEPVGWTTDIRSFLTGYTTVAVNEIILTLADRLNIDLDPYSDVSMENIAMKLRD
jgi:hypothetical protein